MSALFLSPKRSLWQLAWLKPRHLLVLLLMLAGLYQFGAGLLIFAKARLAQYLIADSWQATLADQQVHRPWSWADTYPVAKLTMADHSWYVLAGANGRNLAFGPSHLSATSLPGEPGHSVIVGHRDTQFNALKNLQPGDILIVENQYGQRRYRVTRLRIAQLSQMRYWQEEQEDISSSTLTLVTCYPFDSVAPNPEHRYIVTAEAME